jgi:hypothetical protein
MNTDKQTEPKASATAEGAQVKLICMSFDGDYVTEGSFSSIDEAWNRSNDMGSRWFFYPFHFVTTASGKTIKSAPEGMQHLIGLRVKAVKQHFAQVAKTPEAQNLDAEAYSFLV